MCRMRALGVEHQSAAVKSGRALAVKKALEKAAFSVCFSGW